MKKFLLCSLLSIFSGLLVGCMFEKPAAETPEPWVRIITVVVTAVPIPTVTPMTSSEPIIIATYPLTTPTNEPGDTPTSIPTPTPPPSQTLAPTPTSLDTPTKRGSRLPTPVPDYSPGGGMAVLTGETPFEIAVLPGGWQAYQIGPSENQWGYLVDVNPISPAPAGAYIDTKILPEYSAGQWVDVLWIRAPGILNALAVSVDLIPSQGWDVRYENYTRLTPGDWTGWGLFDNAEGCGGVLDISPDNVDQSGRSAYIQNTRVQPEFPGDWIQVIRVQLSNKAAEQNAWLRYYNPGLLGIEVLRKEAVLSPGTWNGYWVAPSYPRQGYVVEVIPQRDVDNEVAFAVVRPENNGEGWDDMLRVYVPEGRPPLAALMRVLAVRVPGQ